MTSTVSANGRPLMKKTSAFSAANARPGSDSPPTYNNGGLGRHRPNQRGLATAVADRDVLARPQLGDDPEPFPRVGVAVVVVERVESQTLQLGQEPSGDEVDRESAVGDVGDVGCDLREDQRVEQQWFDRADQLDARGGLRQRRDRRPRFEHVVLGIAGVDDMLRQQGRVESGPLGAQQQVAGAPVAGVGGVVRMMPGAVVAVDRCPHPEPRSRRRIGERGHERLR